MNDNELAVVELINGARRGQGLAALRPDERLAAAAGEHAADLASGRVSLSNSHIGSDGSTVLERVGRQGYAAAVAREMTGWGWGTWNREAQMAYWLGSPAHAAIIYDPGLVEVGVAYLSQAVAWTNHSQWWVVVLGRRVAGEVPAPAPAPHTSHVPIVVGGGSPTVQSLDLLSYLRGDGRSYRVGNGWGSFEIFQCQSEGDRFYQVKAWDDLSVVNWEEFVVSGEMIGRDVDTSPGGGRFYRQFGVPWVRRWMRVGESFTQAKRVQFYRLSDCAPVGQHSGTVTDTITLVARHAAYTFPARDWAAVTLADVVELRWEQGGERYWYARGYGLVGWSRTHDDPHSPAWSAIAEMRPGVGRLGRLAIGCL